MKEFWLEIDCHNPRDLAAVNKAIFDFTGSEDDCIESLAELRADVRAGFVQFRRGKCRVCFAAG